MIEKYATREGEWLLLNVEDLINDPDYPSAPAAGADKPQAGSHPHLVRNWLLASSLFPAKWINRLFSVGGIQWQGRKVGLLAFPAADLEKDKLYRQASGSAGENQLKPEAVLYEDDYCLVLNKAAGMPVHASYEGEGGTLDLAACRHLLAQGDPLAVRHIHRLDDDTSGPVLYAKNDLAQWKLDEAMREKAVDRIYLAAVQGRLRKAKGLIDAPIGKDRHHSARRRVTPNGDAALTRYEVVAELNGISIVRLELETGRTHQIRVHMSHIGHPLLGDALYGGATSRLSHQALHGEKLCFPHPLSGSIIEVPAPWPAWLRNMVKDKSF
ncbi:RluA family pseudouridine synthase [Paenibacillus nanensis]|uniref:Pseudouridine synthase n=1 Tax=Paenibacillus nanensis TaxID=393251 RepID=A0A3A1UQJ6_9BACL|nr:RluA family pseudouridine synthase [Paenibacillus nanensis]RIX50534.1 RluA family pseudouridine synthase [Paenibacillus nanensis]